MNTHAYDHARDQAQRLARRHERDLHWAKERRRQHERETAAAVALLATSRAALARRTVVVSLILLIGIAAALAVALAAGLPAFWPEIAESVATVAAAGVLIGAFVSLQRIRARRSAARDLLHSREARLSHTQFHIHESVHSYIDSHGEVVGTRLARSA
ncbi:hypothetical protein [Leifsonia sp. NPDC080035]|uniref:Phage holin family protein n=1 Tax=Leifsonia sp. NPDC080035 TaxID=3143936 RepID=A0AAU7GDY8_9MICO